MYKQIISIMILAVAITACSDDQPKQATKAVVQNTPHTHGKDTVQATAKKAKPFADVVFAEKKDLVCGMPLTAGLEDTAHYKGKIYGFCATGCKDDFLKNPKEFLPKK